MRIPKLNLISHLSKRIPSKDIKLIEENIAEFSYGKMRLVSNPENFSIEKNQRGDVVLRNFRDSFESQEGICEDLTYKAAKKLNKLFGKKIIFVPANSEMTEYDMSHCFLFGFRNTPENRKVVKNLIDRGRKLEKIAREFLAGEMNGSLMSEFVAKFLTDFKKLHPCEKDIKNTIIVDPSFNLVREIHNADDCGSYIPNGFYSVYNQKEALSPDCIIDRSKDGTMVPLGFLSQYVKNIKNETKNPLVFLCIDTSEGVISNSLVTKYKNKGFMSFDYTTLPEDNPLRKFMNHVKQYDTLKEDNPFAYPMIY